MGGECSAPQDALARLGARTATAFGIRRLIIRTCPGGLADLLGRDPAGAGQLALDGKTASRGSRSGDSPAAHLPAAVTDAGQTVTQLRVPDKTNEITCFTALLEPLGSADEPASAPRGSGGRRISS
ncbi:MAG: hypothetical protein QOF44_3613 [Streptomyces sp.]|nr:hypothetical protein [Streptomyces sp.]